MTEKKYAQILKLTSKNLKHYRNLCGYTQEGMTAFGFDYRHYQRIESGNHSISLHTLVRLSEIFKVQPWQLLKERKTK